MIAAFICKISLKSNYLEISSNVYTISFTSITSVPTQLQHMDNEVKWRILVCTRIWTHSQKKLFVCFLNWGISHCLQFHSAAIVKGENTVEVSYFIEITRSQCFLDVCLGVKLWFCKNKL